MVKTKKNEAAVQAFRNIVRALPSAVRRLAAEQIRLVQRELGDDVDLVSKAKTAAEKPKRY